MVRVNSLFRTDTEVSNFVAAQDYFSEVSVQRLVSCWSFDGKILFWFMAEQAQRKHVHSNFPLKFKGALKNNFGEV